MKTWYSYEGNMRLYGFHSIQQGTKYILVGSEDTDVILSFGGTLNNLIGLNVASKSG